MARDRDRTLNPAAAHLKSEKAKSLKKSKAQQSAQRNERLSKRNPDRLQRQIDDLKATEAAQGGKLRPRDKQELEKLERDVRLIHKAKESTGTVEVKRERGGEAGEGRGRGRGRGGASGSTMLGKRRRDDRYDNGGPESEETDEDVRDIPMPGDTPPPIPPRRFRGQQRQFPDSNGESERHALPTKPAPVAKTTYSSAPQIRDLRKEATAKFVPGAVAAKLKQRKEAAAAAGAGAGGGRYLEPEEVDELERGGYLDAEKAAEEAGMEEGFKVMAEAAEMVAGGGTLEEEERAFERELRRVEVEEVEDEGD